MGAIGKATITQKLRVGKLSTFTASPTPHTSINGIIAPVSILAADKYGQREIAAYIAAGGVLSADNSGFKNLDGVITGASSWQSDAAEAGPQWTGTDYMEADGVWYTTILSPWYIHSSDEFEIVSRFNKTKNNAGNRAGIYYNYVASNSYQSQVLSWSSNPADHRVAYNGSLYGTSVYGAPSYMTLFSSISHTYSSTLDPSIQRNNESPVYGGGNGYYSNVPHTMCPWNQSATYGSSSGMRCWDWAWYDGVLTSAERTALWNNVNPGDFRSLITRQPIHYYDPSVRYFDGTYWCLSDMGTGAPGDGSTDMRIYNASATIFHTGAFNSI